MLETKAVITQTFKSVLYVWKGHGSKLLLQLAKFFEEDTQLGEY